MGIKKRRVNLPPNSSRSTNNIIPPRVAGPRTFIKKCLILSFLALVAFLLYSNSLQAPFVFDDWHNIQDNPHIRITTLDWENISKVAVEKYANRPLAHISFALNYYFNQYDVRGYHLVNILIHIFTSILLYFFLQTTLSVAQPSDSSRPESLDPSIVCFLSALIWVAHPIQTQSTHE
jgi:hypothetical protein